MSEQIQNEQQEAKTPSADINEKYLGNFTKNELTTLKNTIARGTDNNEFMLFVQTCVNTGLNPFLGHIHCMVYDGKNGRQLSIQLSSEGVLYLARKAPGFKGVDAQLVHENDEFLYDHAQRKVTKHVVGFPRGRVIGGYCIARHSEFEDKVLLMDVQEVEHMKKGRNANMWNTWFNDMFKKHMLKRVAKEQYGIDLYEDDNIGKAPAPVDQAAAPGRIEVGENLTVDESVQKDNLWAEIENNADDATIKKVITERFKGKTEQDLTLPELAALQKFVAHEMNTKKAEPVEAELVQEKSEFDELDSFFD
jgi:recombination protein RecT